MAGARRSALRGMANTSLLRGEAGWNVMSIIGALPMLCTTSWWELAGMRQGVPPYNRWHRESADGRRDRDEEDRSGDGHRSRSGARGGSGACTGRARRSGAWARWSAEARGLEPWVPTGTEAWAVARAEAGMGVRPWLVQAVGMVGLQAVSSSSGGVQPARVLPGVLLRPPVLVGRESAGKGRRRVPAEKGLGGCFVTEWCACAARRRMT